MKNAFRNLSRPFFGNVHKLFIQKQYIPVSNFSEAVGRKQELKFDVTSLDAAGKYEKFAKVKDIINTRHYSLATRHRMILNVI